MGGQLASESVGVVFAFSYSSTARTCGVNLLTTVLRKQVSPKTHVILQRGEAFFKEGDDLEPGFHIVNSGSLRVLRDGAQLGETNTTVVGTVRDPSHREQPPRQDALRVCALSHVPASWSL